MSVSNRIPDDAAYRSTYPALVGKGSPATQELHVFLGEIDPSPERLQQYYDAVHEWNENHSKLKDKMKACFLGLIFRKPTGEEKVVKVMQSARYFRTDDMGEAVNQIHEDADFFASKGFSVIREKIEASAYGIEGIPQNAEEVKKFNTKYFEFHIKVEKEGEQQELTKEEIESLKKVSRTFTEKFKTPIPLSYNCNRDKAKGDGLGGQRFLNVRFRGVGINEIKPKLDAIKTAIESTSFKVVKVISEYVWYDSFTRLDHGWIDFTEEEKEICS